MTMSQCS
jgi:hypothetical protein